MLKRDLFSVANLLVSVPYRSMPWWLKLMVNILWASLSRPSLNFQTMRYGGLLLYNLLNETQCFCLSRCAAHQAKDSQLLVSGCAANFIQSACQCLKRITPSERTRLLLRPTTVSQPESAHGFHQSHQRLQFGCLNEASGKLSWSIYISGASDMLWPNGMSKRK